MKTIKVSLILICFKRIWLFIKLLKEYSMKFNDIKDHEYISRAIVA